MSRSKFTLEQKEEISLKYINGEASSCALSQVYDVNVYTIQV